MVAAGCRAAKIGRFGDAHLGTGLMEDDIVGHLYQFAEDSLDIKRFDRIWAMAVLCESKPISKREQPDAG